MIVGIILSHVAVWLGTGTFEYPAIDGVLIGLLYLASLPSVFFMRRISLVFVGLLACYLAYNASMDLFFGRPTTVLISSGLAVFFVGFLASFFYLVRCNNRGELT